MGRSFLSFVLYHLPVSILQTLIDQLASFHHSVVLALVFSLRLHNGLLGDVLVMTHEILILPLRPS